MPAFVTGQTLRFRAPAYGAPTGTLVRVTRVWGAQTMYPGGYSVERLDGGLLDAMVFGEVCGRRDTVIGGYNAEALLEAVN